MPGYYDTTEPREILEVQSLWRRRERLLSQIEYMTNPAVQILITGLLIGGISYIMFWGWVFWVICVSGDPDSMDIGKIMFCFIGAVLVVGLRIKHIGDLVCIRSDLDGLNDSIVAKLEYLKFNNLTCELES